MGKPHTTTRKRNISRAMRKSFLESLEARTPESEPTCRRCPRCEETKSLEEFGVRKCKRKSGVFVVLPNTYCKPCEAERAAKRRAKLVSEDHEAYLVGKRESRQRVSARVAEEIVKRVEVEPLAEFLTSRAESVKEISENTRVDERRIRSIINREESGVSIQTVDRILCGLDCVSELNTLYPIPEPHRHFEVIDPKGLLKS